MVRQAYHDRLDLPLVLRLVEGCAPFKALRRFKGSMFKSSRTDSDGNFHVSGILETSI